MNLTAVEIARLAARAGWPTKEIANITAIALAESSGDPAAASSDSNGGSFGLTQINHAEWAEFGHGGNINDPEANLRGALRIWRAQGYNPWCTATPAMNHGHTGCSGYGSGAAGQYMGQATAAARGVRGGTSGGSGSVSTGRGRSSARRERVLVSPPEMTSLATSLKEMEDRVVSVHRQATNNLLIPLEKDQDGSAGASGAAETEIHQAVAVLAKVVDAGPQGLAHLVGALWQQQSFVTRVRDQALHADKPSATLTSSQLALLATLARDGVNKATLARDKAEMLARDRSRPTTHAVSGTKPHAGGNRGASASPRGGANPGAGAGPGGAVTTAATVAGGWHVLRTTGGIPPGFARYGNGRVPLTALTPVGAGQHLWKPAAVSFLRMRSLARSAGVNLTLAASYRPYATQVALSHSEPGLAAVPGHSDHGWGRAIDVDGARSQQWLDANAGRFGWYHQVPGEPWHFSFGPEHIVS